MSNKGTGVLAQPANLPVQPTPFIGRQQELQALIALLRRDDARLVTLTGPGGTGKTRLAIEAATALLPAFPAGVVFVPLAALQDPAYVGESIARTLEQVLALPENPDRSLRDLLQEELQSARLLLVLDNFEQVIEAAALVAECLSLAARLHVLVTSRSPLKLRGEKELAIPPLALPAPGQPISLGLLAEYDALKLLIERAQDVQPGFALSEENAATLTEICQRLDGLPLAIELAAPHLKVFTPEALLARLSSRLRLLTGGARDLPRRQQTLRAAVEWSYQLLDAQEQPLFRRLSVFVGGWTIEAAEAICGLDSDMTEGLIALVDKSLIQRLAGEHGEPRFSMLETIREYALERLREAGEHELLAGHHLAWYRGLLAQASPELRRSNQAEWKQRLQQEWPNINAALDWASAVQDGPALLQSAADLWVFWVRTGYLSEGRQWLERALEVEAGDPAQVEVLYGAGLIAKLQGDQQQARLWHERGLALSRQLGNTYGAGRALSGLGQLAMVEEQLPLARDLFQQSIELLRLTPDDELAWSLYSLACVAMSESDDGEALRLIEESVRLLQSGGDLEGAAIVGAKAGVWQLRRGDYPAARRFFEQHLRVAQSAGNSTIVALFWNVLGDLARLEGASDPAATWYQQSMALEGPPEELAKLRVHALRGLGQLALSRGDHAQAARQLRASLLLAQPHNPAAMGPALMALVVLAVERDAPELAARLCGALDALAVVEDPLLISDLQRYREARQLALLALGAERFASLLAAGRALPPEELASQALLLGEHSPHAVPPAAQLASAASAPPVSGAPAPDALTEREREVLRLLAEGLSNKQIAERLVISARTVETHLSSIYAKLGVTSRSAATRLALTQGLG